MPNPYEQANSIAGAFANVGNQFFKGQAAYDAGKMKAEQMAAQQQMLGSHTNLYNAQAQKTQEEAQGLAQRRQYQNPEFSSKVAAALAGLNDSQGSELSNYQQNGNWGVNPGKELPAWQEGPPMPDMPKSAPNWYTPQLEQRVNQARGVVLGNLAGTGNSKIDDMAKAFTELLGQGRIDQAIADPQQAALLGRAIAASKGNALFHQGSNGVMDQFTGQETLNDVGRSAALENRAQAGNASASAALHRAQIPEVQSRIDLNKSKIGQPTVNPDGSVNEPAVNFGKAPSGYRFKSDGSMEPIPGGPADAKAMSQAANKAAGTTDVDSAIATLRDAYTRLENNNGITNTNNGPLSNLIASSSSSSIGQAVGRALGTGNQSARNDIAMTRPALLASLMKATGMSAKQMDSNAELKLWLATATDPTLDVQANRRALDNIEKKYIGNNRQEPSGANQLSNSDRVASVLAARNAVANGKDKAEVIRRLEAAGITDHGIK